MQADEITITNEEGIILAQVEYSNLEEEQSKALLEQLIAAAEQSPAAAVILNLTKVMAMPSMAIGALVTLWKKLQDGGHRFILVGVQPPVRDTLAVCRLDKLFQFNETVDDAKLRLRPNPV